MINPVYPLASCATRTVGADTPALQRRDFCCAAERDGPKGTIKRRALTDNEAVYPIESP